MSKSKSKPAKKPAPKQAPKPTSKPAVKTTAKTGLASGLKSLEAAAALASELAAPPAGPALPPEPEAAPAPAAASAPAPSEAPIIATLHGVRVPAAPHLGPSMITSLNEGRYERNEVACGLAAIPKGARILELGAGAGVVGAILAMNLAPKALLSIEANPALIPHIAHLHATNGLSDIITLRHAVVLTAPDAPASIDFFVMGNFLGSGLVSRKPDRAQTVSVPVLRYADLVADFAPDTIMMDIEGGELDFLRHADLTGINTFVAEFHRDIYGREGMQECRRLLSAQGLRIDEATCRPGVHVWKR
ncbi:FkbM family methyltransferase [Paragemmobacter straminiformis]|uniref:FkbM family methyltransferase n=1 Tax=Paragemmobacter straminiformis TaxID=2045119 RepID=A0A842IB40_9RHOB|nr:FkbM family methyltransferase [Gemmobacter straminiformis]MBC2836806.1 FkbM family methyltransferase [Gemmobacter straminiformis]